MLVAKLFCALVRAQDVVCYAYLCTFISSDSCVSPLLRYVCRAGHKLEAALAAFGVNPMGLVCLDSGVSTGGFTDCLLQQGAAHVSLALCVCVCACACVHIATFEIQRPCDQIRLQLCTHLDIPATNYHIYAMYILGFSSVRPSLCTNCLHKAVQKNILRIMFAICLELNTVLTRDQCAP
jgi:hypothetical protein